MAPGDDVDLGAIDPRSTPGAVSREWVEEGAGALVEQPSVWTTLT